MRMRMQALERVAHVRGECPQPTTNTFYQKMQYVLVAWQEPAHEELQYSGKPLDPHAMQTEG